jgi:hypothetical protein
MFNSTVHAKTLEAFRRRQVLSHNRASNCNKELHHLVVDGPINQLLETRLMHEVLSSGLFSGPFRPIEA